MPKFLSGRRAWVAGATGLACASVAAFLALSTPTQTVWSQPAAWSKTIFRHDFKFPYISTAEAKVSGVRVHLRTTTYVDLSNLQGSVLGLVQGAGLPNNNCASYSTNNKTARAEGASLRPLSNGQAQLSATLHGEQWACTQNPVPNSKLEWHGVIPKLVFWPGDPWKTILGQKQINFSFELTPNSTATSISVVRTDASDRDVEGFMSNSVSREVLKVGLDDVPPALRDIGLHFVGARFFDWGGKLFLEIDGEADAPVSKAISAFTSLKTRQSAA